MAVVDWSNADEKEKRKLGAGEEKEEKEIFLFSLL